MSTIGTDSRDSQGGRGQGGDSGLDPWRFNIAQSREAVTRGEISILWLGMTAKSRRWNPQTVVAEILTAL